VLGKIFFTDDSFYANTLAEVGLKGVVQKKF
jgi:hypothetical protein